MSIPSFIVFQVPDRPADKTCQYSICRQKKAACSRPLMVSRSQSFFGAAGWLASLAELSVLVSVFGVSLEPVSEALFSPSPDLEAWPREAPEGDRLSVE
jgi:hypothetical protein